MERCFFVKLSITLLCLLANIFAFTQRQPSVLSSGDWFKVGITTTGIHRLDLDALNNLGMNTSSLDPRTIKVYGNGVKGVLPQVNGAYRPIDLVENAIYVSGEEDASFDNDDYLLFYGIGPNKFDWTNSGLEYEKNIYADTSYYFVTLGGEDGKRIGLEASLDDSGIDVVAFNDAIIFEEDVINILESVDGEGSGRGWYGELLNNGEIVSANYNIEGLISPMEVVLSGVSRSSVESYFQLSSNGSIIGDLPINSVLIEERYAVKARQEIDTFLVNSTNVDVSLDIKYVSDDASGRGFLDYYALLFNRDLRFIGDELAFRTTDNAGALLTYNISNASGTTIWDVTDPTAVKEQQYELQSSTAVFHSQSENVEEFVVFSGSDFPIPNLFGTVANQDIMNENNLDGIIVAHPSFKAQALRLEQFHEANGLSVKVVAPFEIYNEFSSGRQDVTAIRDYAKAIYDMGNQRLKYLLLFGDCSYDYKYRESNLTNYVPIYESRESFHPIDSHSSDDFFGFLEDDEGEWIESISGDHTMEIGVGRLPVNTPEEAEAVVDKIIYYSTSPNALGEWRNEIAYFADDGDTNTHAIHAERLSDLVDSTYLQYNIDKLLLDAFEQESGPSTETSEASEDALKAKIKNGAFIINFMGHGSERQWTDEQVLTRPTIRSFTNLDKLPIFMTATCEFGRYDDPGVVSGAEELLINSNGGAIALLTTTRPVFASSNFELNQSFHESMFLRTDDEPLRLGDVFRLTKNGGLAGTNNRNFALLGDPMMIPAYPKSNIIINELLTTQDTLSALEEVTFTGQIRDESSLITAFNGILSISVFDIEQTFQTKGQESDPFNYTLRNNALFRGEASVTNGAFSFTFTVPKNISYQFKQGKMTLYARDENLVRDADGAATNFVLGGTSPNQLEDDIPPEVDLFINDPSFVNGSVVGESPLFVANVSDENGISITSNGLSNGISMEFNGELINLNEYYTSDIDTYESGSVVFPFQDLDPGSYTITFSVYDSYNNLTTREISFQVSDEAFISVFNMTVYPNPVRDLVNFLFEHDREEQNLEIELYLYDSRGNLVSETYLLDENSRRSVLLTWEPKSNSGALLTKGIYYYRLKIISQFDGAIKEITSRLVIDN